MSSRQPHDTTGPSGANTHDLIHSVLPLVTSIVVKTCGRYDPDLVQEGRLGLIAAAARFDPTRGVTFANFAAIRIRGAVLDELERRGRRRSHEHSLDALDADENDTHLAVHDPGFDKAEWAADSTAINAAFNAMLEHISSHRDRTIIRRCLAGETVVAIAADLKLSERRIFQIRDRFLHAVRDNRANDPTHEQLKVA